MKIKSNNNSCPIHFMSNFQKNSKDYGEPDITYQLAGAAEQRQPRSKAENRAKLFN